MDAQVAGLVLVALALALLIIQQYLFGYRDDELVSKTILALLNYGLTLLAVSYGIMG